MIRRLVLLFTVSLFFGVALLAADDLGPAIAVTGEAIGKPDAMVMELSADATANNAVDALQLCKQKAEGAEKAIKALGIAGMKVEREMYAYSSPAAANPYGLQQGAAPAGTRVTQDVKVKLKLADAGDREKLADTIARVFDAAGKSGVGFKQTSVYEIARGNLSGSNYAVRYVLEDASGLRAQALADAFVKAEQVRQGLEKAGVKLGKLLRVGTGPLNSSFENSVYMAMIANGTARDEDSKSVYASGPDEVKVLVAVQFVYGVEK